MNSVLKVSIIGVGKQGSEYLHYLQQCDNIILDSVVDSNHEQLKKIKCSDGVHKLTCHMQLSVYKPDVAIICLPHDQYFEIIGFLLALGVDVIKEKPYALSCDEALAYEKLQRNTGKNIYTLMKRRWDPLFQVFHVFKSRVGQIFYFEAAYTKNIKDLGGGWRSSCKQSGGGALIDMGYHFIDLLIWYLGKPSSIYSQFGFGNRSMQVYDVEDTAIINVTYNAQTNIIGHLVISRVLAIEKEELIFCGTEGGIKISNQESHLFDRNGFIIEYIKKDKNTSSDVNVKMLEDLFAKIRKGEKGVSHLEHVSVIERAYKSTQNGQGTLMQRRSGEDYVEAIS